MREKKWMERMVRTRTCAWAGEQGVRVPHTRVVLQYCSSPCRHEAESCTDNTAVGRVTEAPSFVDVPDEGRGRRAGGRASGAAASEGGHGVRRRSGRYSGGERVMT